jgi:hypothetical protein
MARAASLSRLLWLMKMVLKRAVPEAQVVSCDAGLDL